MIDIKQILEKADKLVEEDLKNTSAINKQRDLELIRKTLFYIWKAIEDKQ